MDWSMRLEKRMCLKVWWLVLPAILAGCRTNPAGTAGAGSSQCKECHEAFYAKWSTSHHGLAMQPFTAAFARAHLSSQDEPIRIGGASYRAMTAGGEGYVLQEGTGGTKRFPMAHVMGGKNVYYFLTPLERGRLQVLPLAWDVQKKAWFDMAATGVRMHAEAGGDAALPWTDSAFTFNTSCYSCHVSQLQTNYDAATDSYRTTWREPGINCETCHGNGDAHVALFQKDPKKRVEDARILRITRLTVQQRNEMCAPCHAKMSPISAGYQVTQRFFDHYDLVTFEDADYYPDGRDLGENYTYTSWLLSPCARGGKLDCMHCHTSSGRYKFAQENPNGACLPCHQRQVGKAQAHSRHRADGPGGRCIDCHMPKTRFANMSRSDHSMLPPTPAATLRFQSPNACNLCHREKDAAWADALVRKWHKRDYQKPVLDRASLIQAGRKGDWRRLPELLAYLQGAQSEPVFQASLIRLLERCTDARKWPVLEGMLRHSHPLVRAAAASSFGGYMTAAIRDGLVRATRDEYRLVRIWAAATLAGVPADGLAAGERESVARAIGELLASYNARPDNFAGRTNLGNYYMDRGEIEQAISSFEAAVRLRPDSVGTLVNASLAYSRAGRSADAERVLKQALGYYPDNAAANFNLGLLLAELGRVEEAEAALRRAWAADPQLAPAAYNLAVLVSRKDIGEAIELCRRAVALRPAEMKYSVALAQFLVSGKKTDEAIRLLSGVIAGKPASEEPYALLAEIYLGQRRPEQAARVYRQGAANSRLPESARAAFAARAR